MRTSIPMRLLRIPEPSDHPQFLWEPKMDGSRALAHIEGHRCTLISRSGHVFKSWPQLAEETAQSVRANDAILDGEIVCLDPDGRSNFKNLLFRREWPFFCAFDLIALDGEDLRDLALTERKHRLTRIMPRVESRVRFVDHVDGRGVDLFRLACERDLEGIVGKWRLGRYCSDGRTTSWVKVKNPDYSQMEGRTSCSRRGAKAGHATGVRPNCISREPDASAPPLFNHRRFPSSLVLSTSSCERQTCERYRLRRFRGGVPIPAGE